MPSRQIPFGKPLLGNEEREAVAGVLSGTMLVHGEQTKAFEKAFAERAGSRHAIALSSCTAALHLSLRARDIGAGDAVIVPAMTHVATAHSAEYCGARPLFVDVVPESGNLDAAAAAEASEKAGNVRAVLPVHYLGLPCDMDAIGVIASRFGAMVVEDCALAIDATYDGRKAGTLGDTGCFSFYPVKHMTSIEGGMLTTDDDELAARVEKLRAFGYDRSLGERSEPGVYDIDALGLNFRMNEVEAAVGLAQLGKLDAFQAARARNFEALAAALRGIDELTIFEPKQGKAQSSHYCLNVVLPADGRIARRDVVAHLKSAGVGSSVHYPVALPLSRYYSEKYGYKPGDFPIAEWLAAQTISLPVGPHLDTGDPDYIAEEMKKAILTARTK